MKNKGRGTLRARLKLTLVNMRLNFIALAGLVALSVLGVLVIRSALFENARETGTALARNYAAEEQSDLTVYETLLSFGTVTLDDRLRAGESDEQILEWIEMYYSRINAVLGEDVVDPYVVREGRIIAANPWEGDETYDVYATDWYRRAIEADGEIVFTDLYTDAISGAPVITAVQKCESSDCVLAFDILPENMHFLVDDIELEQGGSFFLCDRRGSLIYAKTDLAQPDEEIQSYLTDLIACLDENGMIASFTDLDGNERAAYSARMDNGWYSIVTLSHESILGDLEWLILSYCLMIGLFLLVLIGMSWREMRTNERIARTNETVRVLGNSYYALYRIDYEAGTYEMIKGSDYVRERIPPTGPYADLLRTAGEVMEPDAFKDFCDSFSVENIRRLVSQRVRNFGGDFLRRFGESMRWVNVRVLFDESLAPEEVVLCFQEVEEEKQRRLRERKLLEDALEIARKNEAAKQSFFSNMSHDMRTPLNAIIGLSDLARSHIGDAQKVSDDLLRINASSRQLLNLINDILDMSRMEQGKLELTNRAFDLRACVEECLGAFRFEADTQGKALELNMDVRDAVVQGDPFRITQMLNNLLSNAFKFTARGDSVSVRVTQTEEAHSGEHEKYRFEVADTGMGMSEEFLPHLFEPYSREMRFGARQTAGTGLGMSITKSIVTQMNGEIQVASAPGKGTTFTIVLPLAPVRDAANEVPAPDAPAERAEDEAPALGGMRILLAEDNEVNMEITTELLSMNGAIVTQAWNGEEAVLRFSEAPEGAFDAILMDMQMPVMDGCEAAKRIRALKRSDARGVPIVAVTANAFAEDVAATVAAGMNAHVSKPIDFAILVKTLRGLVRGAGQ